MGWEGMRYVGLLRQKPEKVDSVFGGRVSWKSGGGVRAHRKRIPQAPPP